MRAAWGEFKGTPSRRGWPRPSRDTRPGRQPHAQNTAGFGETRATWRVARAPPRGASAAGMDPAPDRVRHRGGTDSARGRKGRSRRAQNRLDL